LDAKAGDPFDKGEAFMLLEPTFKPLKFPAKARIEDGLAKGGGGGAARARIGNGGGNGGGSGGGSRDSASSTPPPGASKGLRDSLERSRARAEARAGAKRPKRPKRASPPPRDRKTPSSTPASAGRLSLSELRTPSTPSVATPASAGPLSLSDLRTPTRRSSGKKKAATSRDYATESAEAEREQLTVHDRLQATERRFRKAQQKFTETHRRRQVASQKKGRGRNGGGS
jgi:hypothetical protein